MRAGWAAYPPSRAQTDRLSKAKTRRRRHVGLRDVDWSGNQSPAKHRDGCSRGLSESACVMERKGVTYDTDDFAQDVIERSHSIPVLVDFWASWCGPCKVLGPILERLAHGHEEEWVLAKLDTERHSDVAARYGIRSIPNVKLFVDGEVSTEFVGALPEAKIVEWLRKAVPSKYGTQIEQARGLILKSQAAKAREMLEPIVAVEPDNDQALAALAFALLESDSKRALSTAGTIKPGSAHFEAAEAVRALVDLYARDDGQVLPQDAVRDLYQIAIRDARANDFEAALGSFVAVIRKNRYYDDDGARKACIAIFKLAGEDHRLTKTYRPTLSTALY